MRAFETSLDFWLSMNGKRSKKGVWKYTLPCIWNCMCYVSGCNLHGGYNKMLLMVYLGRTLKLMQNGLRTTGIGYIQYREDAFCVHVNVFRQLDGEEECFWN